MLNSEPYFFFYNLTCFIILLKEQRWKHNFFLLRLFQRQNLALRHFNLNLIESCGSENKVIKKYTYNIRNRYLFFLQLQILRTHLKNL